MNAPLISTSSTRPPSVTVVTVRTRLLTFTLPLVACFALGAASCSSPEESPPSPDANTSGGGKGGSSSESDSDAEVCTLGESEDQCAGDPTQSCSPFLLTTDNACDEDKDCPAEALCFESDRFEDSAGECYSLIAECVPRCAGDFECEDGSFCDPLSGECIDREPEGLAFGHSCDPNGNECRGLCVEIDAGEFECEEHCRVGVERGCGVSDLSDAGFACAFFAYDLDDFGVEQGEGDTGVCAQLCDCNDDCPGTQLCLAAPQDGYAGVCVGGLDRDESIESCSSDGAGGAPQ